MTSPRKIQLLALSFLLAAPSLHARQPLINACAKPQVPAALAQGELKVPDSERAVLKLFAQGWQKYSCKAKLGEGGKVTGYEWVLTGPDAELFTDARHRNKVGTHFAGPTWQLDDGSRFVGNAAKDAPGFVKAPSARPKQDVPYLRIPKNPNASSGELARLSYVQRGETEGGLPSSYDLCDAGHVDEKIAVEYKATYLFYASKAELKPTHACTLQRRASDFAGPVAVPAERAGDGVTSIE